MNCVVDSKISAWLNHAMHVEPHHMNTVLHCMRKQAQMAGYWLDERFARAGLGAGPEARVASRIVNYALFGGGTETAEYFVRKEIGDWIRNNAPISM